ncbi:hypothetical protein M501DRAFT_993862 [Patellaria atrata CBS 101060]|uniref:RING-type domain-containing protein n=1 Tax=Patellaria atrata CBS 101060 TaxID=1346257 RepID=A0A9P4VRK5_9PEZI|nr:hypothetical protein M501DRAFT_993862 [Patellaria atrata CBS 101060]
MPRSYRPPFFPGTPYCRVKVIRSYRSTGSRQCSFCAIYRKPRSPHSYRDNPTNREDITHLNCGHVYHVWCLDKWCLNLAAEIPNRRAECKRCRLPFEFVTPLMGHRMPRLGEYTKTYGGECRFRTMRTFVFDPWGFQDRLERLRLAVLTFELSPPPDPDAKNGEQTHPSSITSRGSIWCRLLYLLVPCINARKVTKFTTLFRLSQAQLRHIALSTIITENRNIVIAAIDILLCTLVLISPASPSLPKDREPTKVELSGLLSQFISPACSHIPPRYFDVILTVALLNDPELDERYGVLAGRMKQIVQDCEGTVWYALGNVIRELEFDVSWGPRGETRPSGWAKRVGGKQRRFQ